MRGEVGATQQGRIEASVVDVRWEYGVMVGNGGSPWRGQGDAPEGKRDSVNVVSDEPGRATRYGQILIIEEDTELP